MINQKLKTSRSGGRAARVALRSAPLAEDKRPVRAGMSGGKYKPLSDAEVLRIHHAALDALDYLRKLQSDLPIESPDIIFLDIKMPFMDGFDFLEAFKELHLNLYLPSKIFMVSSSTNEQDIQRSKDSGIVVDCIEKPLSIAHLERIAELHFS